MSALDQLRQVINTSRDLFKEYDSDAVSLTSTVVEEEGDYDSNGIIAEDPGKERPYLVSWENYALDQCTGPHMIPATVMDWNCTWEPKHNIDAGDILLRWKQLKDELGTVAFQRENEANKRAYAEAQAKAQAARDRRHAKREQKRQRLRRRHHTIVSDDDSSDDESFSTGRTRQGLFVQDEESPNPASPVLDPPPKVPPSVTRQPPLQQSSPEEESLSEGEISGHPLISEPRKSNITHKDRNNTAKEPTHRSIPSGGGSGSSVSNKTTTAPVSRKTRDEESRASIKPVTRNAATSNTMRAIKTAQPKQASHAINFIDEPMEKHKRLWSTDQQYSKAAIRWRAEKRSRTEAAPDFSALSFVNGPSPTLPKAPVPRPNDNPYGRRETANHRRDEETEDDRPQREVTNTTAPLAAWEVDKVPQVCFHWKSSICPRKPQECRFMHRDTDPEGKPFPVGDFDGRVPHKYRSPPITCPFWYKGRKCTKTDEECSYAHRDTGWAELNGVPTKIDDLPPQYLAPVGPSKLAPTTCSFWLYNPQSCSKSAADCKYAHRNTGWARSESDPHGEPVRIDPELKPRCILPKDATPPVTCLFWLRAEKSCSKPDSDCKYAHWNTGWAPPIENNDRPLPPRFRALPGNRAAVPIDRAERPYYNGATRELAVDYEIPKNGDPPITCYFWLEGSSSCGKLPKNCRFAHRNTGWVLHNDKPKQIDPTMLPRCRKFDPTDAIQVPYNHTKPTLQPLSRALDEDSMDMVISMPTNTASAAGQDLHHQQVQSPLETQVAVHREPAAVPSLSQVRSKIEDVLNLDIVEMFFPLALGDNEPLERQAMLLYDPKEHSEELELITRWLLLHNVRVTNLWYSGAWSQFRHDVGKHKSGVIIAHPDFEQYTELPGFGDVLRQRVRVWSVGPQPPPEFVFGVEPFPERLRHERVGLFPHGGLIYITDDVFEQEPQLALSIVKLFADKIEQLRQLEGPDSWWLRVDDAYLLWRLCVRPELMEYLYFKCRDNSEELEAGNPEFMSYYELYVLLTATHYIEQDSPIAPLSTVNDKYPILSHRRQLAEHPSIDYFNLLGSTQEGANTQMITHYAEVHSAFLRRDYRHFYVVHTEPTATCAQQWKADIHTITEIVTPERCIEELSKSSKESLFDFMEWALEPKVQKPDAAPAEPAFRDTPMMSFSPRDDIQEVEHTAY